MNSSDSQPKLPTWIFILTDLVALAAAVLIGATSKRPLSAEAMFWMVVCVIVGAIVGLVPLIVRYERQKNETLDDRQRALESLARTVHESSEQIGIAANGMHEIAELAQRNLRHAEHLPQKLQEKIAEFQAGLTTAADAEKEELERELLALRTSESERLDTVSQRIAKSAAEWTKLEATTQQHLTAANEALGKLSLGTASAIGKAQAAAEQALTQARTEAAKTIGEASGQATKAIETAKATALAEIDAKFATAAAAAVERVKRELAAHAAAPAVPPAAPAPSPVEPPEPPAAPAAPVVAPSQSAPLPAATEPPIPNEPAAAEPNGVAVAAAAPVKRPRKPKREEVPATDAAPAPLPEATPPATEPPSQAAAKTDATVAAAAEPQPIPAAQIPEVAPIAPHTQEPFDGNLAGEKPAAAAQTPSPAVTDPASAAEPVAAAVPEAPAPAPRKRAKKESAPVPVAAPEEPSLGLDLDGTHEPAEPAAMERVISSDGATRLVVTAYIGIGNRLFIRGAGPGLSWEKGVPLQFISIGKWRWETNDATSAVQFKLYKNDEVECTALGSQNLDPGHQQEVTAAF